MDNKTIITDATLFHRTFSILADRVNSGAVSGNNEDLLLIVPAAMNGAFACELYMKSMIQDKPGHKLDDLFDRLDSSVQKTIKNIMIREMKSQSSNYDDTSFLADLSKHAMAFVDWRYFYEDGKTPSVDLIFLSKFLAVLKGIAEACEKGADFSNIVIVCDEVSFDS